MLQLDVQIAPEGWDEKNEVFVEAKTTRLQLEHSLVSLSKWESKWNKPFLSKDNKTTEETIDYIKCMTLTQNVKQEVYDHITQADVNKIVDYINAPMTATTFHGMNNSKRSNEQVTSELIYYWMISLNIPFECQKWHINRLLTLIRVCETKNNPGKKMSKRQIMSQNVALNAARRKKYGTKG